MEIELGDSFWRSFSGLAPDSHPSFHRDGSKRGEDKGKRIIRVSCLVGCGAEPSLGVAGWPVWSRALCDAGAWRKARGYSSENGLPPKMRGAAVSHTSLCLLESASETAWASMDTYPAPFLELWLMQLRQSGIDCLAILVSLVSQGGQDDRAGFCLPGVQRVHTLAEASTFSVRVSKQTQGQKGRAGRHCHTSCFAFSDGCLGGLPGNYETGFMVLLEVQSVCIFSSQEPINW